MNATEVIKPGQNYLLDAEDASDWTAAIAGGALIAGGLLLLFGHRRAGTVAAASGAALALLDQQAAVRALWKQLPVYIDEVQRIADQVQGTVEDLSAKRDKLRRIMAR